MGFSVWVVMSGLMMIGMAVGFLMHRSDFCMAGAFRDVFLFRSYRLIRPLVLLASLSALLFELCRIADLLPVYPFPWFAPPAGVNIVGGVVFGLGMVMAGGCVVGVLYKMGAGNLLALIAFTRLAGRECPLCGNSQLVAVAAQADSFSNQCRDRAATVRRIVDCAGFDRGRCRRSLLLAMASGRALGRPECRGGVHPPVDHGHWSCRAGSPDGAAVWHPHGGDDELCQGCCTAGVLACPRAPGYSALFYSDTGAVYPTP